MPNIGILILKNTNGVIKMCDTAWRDYYTTASMSIRKNPGKDQNKVVSTMQRFGGRNGAGFGSDTSLFDRKTSDSSNRGSVSRINWRYIPVTEAVLIDKIFKFANQAVELGGEATSNILTPPSLGGTQDMTFMYRNTWQGTIGGQKGDFHGQVPPASVVHVTCFEKSTKIMGLKAANAYWNPYYYDPSRPTITKKLLMFHNKNLQSYDKGYLNTRRLEEEVQSLVYLAMKLNRTLIIPNVLLEQATGRHELILNSVDPKKSNIIQRPGYKGNTLWPGFRVLNLKTDDAGWDVLKVNQVEPAYYWRVKRDYTDTDTDTDTDADAKASSQPSNNSGVPEPTVISFTPDVPLSKIEEVLAAFTPDKISRLVIHMLPEIKRVTNLPQKAKYQQETYVSKTLENIEEYQQPTKTDEWVREEQAKTKKWAQHSVGDFDTWEIESSKYQPLPSLVSIIEIEKEKRQKKNKGYSNFGSRSIISKNILMNARLCTNIGERMKGNRSCFGKCN
jgi:hypothetical protein